MKKVSDEFVLFVGTGVMGGLSTFSSFIFWGLLGAENSRGYRVRRSEEHTSELQSLMRISYAVFCLKKKKITHVTQNAEHYCIPKHSISFTTYIIALLFTSSMHIFIITYTLLS